MQSLTYAEDCLFKMRKDQLQIWEEIFWRRKAFITPCSEEGAYGRVSVATREGYIIAKERATLGLLHIKSTHDMNEYTSYNDVNATRAVNGRCP